ncbi:TPA: Dabb family protein [Salmonella enterica subsp. enterica serovar Bahrenfeld]|nr:Dabb family protein [Salmonella enterica]HAR9009565.1 Dabb family protein [Salmonella enterica]HAR9319068.1 Dabb family protein [Salmonella enterica]
MVRHILLISFISDATPSQVNNIRERFLLMPELIPGINSVEWGVNSSKEKKNRGFTHSVVMTFNSKSSLDLYLCHPNHKVLQKYFIPLLSDIIVFDYNNDDR